MAPRLQRLCALHPHHRRWRARAIVACIVTPIISVGRRFDAAAAAVCLAWPVCHSLGRQTRSRPESRIVLAIHRVQSHLSTSPAGRLDTKRLVAGLVRGGGNVAGRVSVCLSVCDEVTSLNKERCRTSHAAALNNALVIVLSFRHRSYCLQTQLYTADDIEYL